MGRHSAAWRAAHARRRRFSTEKMIALRDQGLSQSEAARRLGVTQKAVAARLKKEGLTWPASRLSALDDATFARFWACHEITTQELADWLGVTRNAVSWRARQAGLPSRKHVRRRKADDATLRDMWMAGVSSADIARHFGYAGRSCVSRRARMLGLPSRVRRRGTGGVNGWDGTIPMWQYLEARIGERMAAEAST